MKTPISFTRFIIPLIKHELNKIFPKKLKPVFSCKWKMNIVNYKSSLAGKKKQNNKTPAICESDKQVIPIIGLTL